MKPRLLITRQLPDRVVAAARQSFAVTLRTATTGLDAAAARTALLEHDAILPTLGDDFAAEVFASGPLRCRILANFGAGTNHLAVAAAQAAGVVVTNTPGAVTEATADIALTLMLMAARRAAEGERLVRAGQWSGWQPTQMLGQPVSGQRLGIVGMGRIGQAVARRAHHGFGMVVRFFNRSAVADPGAPATQVASLPELLGQSDFVVIAVPGGPTTHHLIGAAELAALPRHAILVNVARGDVVDEAALITALQTGRIAGAGLDVYEHEPMVPAALRALDNVTLLPHLGTAVREVREAMGLMALDNLAAFFTGRPVPNPVTGT